MNIEYISPSYKRAGKTKVTKWLDDVVLAVHKFEEEQYREHHNNLLILSDDSKGNMAKVRNEILDRCNADICVMLDDDVSSIGFHENGEQNTLAPSELNEIILNMGEMAEDLGTVLFGFNLQSDPKFYREYSPFSFLTPVLGTFSCILTKTDIRYDDRLGLNEDYDFALQVLNKHRRILRNNKFYYMADHLTLEGGCGAYRVLDEEKRQAEIMIRKWGSRVVKYDFSKSTNPRINAPLSGI